MKKIYNLTILLVGGGLLVLGTLLSCKPSSTAKTANQGSLPSANPPAVSVLGAESSLPGLFQKAGLSYMGDKGIVAPDFTVQDLKGGKTKLSDHRGKVVFLNFWATWCPPCREEMPSIERMHQQYKDTDIRVLAVSVQEEPSVVQAFLQKNAYTFPIFLDPEAKAAQLYGIRGIPTTFIIDRKGNVQGALVGGKDWATPSIFAVLDALLKE